MNKNLIIIGIIFFLLIVGFNGCTKQETSKDINKVELVSYNIETQKWDYGYKTIGNSFIHSEDAELYLITGTVKNIAGEMLNSIKITAKFYDNKHNFLREETTYLWSIANTYTEDFRISYYDTEKYFENVCDVIFEFEVT